MISNYFYIVIVQLAPIFGFVGLILGFRVAYANMQYANIQYVNMQYFSMYMPICSKPIWQYANIQ